MRLEKKISIIVPHVRGDFPYVEDQTVHNFQWLLDSLRGQDFPMNEFELVLPDTLWEQRKNYFGIHLSNRPCFQAEPFTVKHVPKKVTPWTELRFCDISNGYNTGLIHADGELTLHLSSGCQFGPELLRQCWDWHNRGRGVGILYDRKAGENVVWQDGRRADVFSAGGLRRIDAPLKPFTHNTSFYLGFYGHQSAPLDTCLKVNGYNELFDGTKGWEDVEVGVRLHKAGLAFVHDENIELVEHAHMDPGLPDCIAPDCHATEWKLFNDVRNEIMSRRCLDPEMGFEANRQPMPRYVMQAIEAITTAKGGALPAWRKTYFDPRLCLDLRTLWNERRERDGLPRL